MSSAQPEQVKPAESPKLNLRFLYGYCNNVGAMRRFYTEAIGMKEHSFQDTKEFGWLNYRSQGMELMFFRWDKPLPVDTAFAAQPGGGGGEAPKLSWSIEVPEALYRETVQRVRASGAKANAASPVWLQNSYWGFVVLDPMGNTVEIYMTPKEKPASTTWTD